MNLVAAGAAVLALAALAVAGYLVQRSRAHARWLATMESRWADLAEQLKALTAGALGQGERLNRLEEDLGRLRHRLDTVASQETGGGPAFAQAIRLARRGVGVEEVMETCGLSRMEAELVVTLHRGGDGDGDAG